MAGLGHESDFMPTAGSTIFRPRAAPCARMSTASRAFLDNQGADVILFQEIAHGGPVNYWIDLRGRVDERCCARRPHFLRRLQDAADALAARR